ncbi:MAG: ISL3 family transposase, partial [Oscillochloris sp.]|nr:ISL3 family transposase [Oscillochloris sp.]
MRVDMLHVITQLLLPSQTDLHLDRVVADDQTQTFILEVTSTQAAPACPRCARAGPRVHSRYTRTLADLPWADVAVQVQLHVRKCFCVTETCSRRIFCERVPQLAQPWARRTRRLAAHQERIGVALGGAAGERLADDLDQPASRDSLIRLVRAHDLPAPPTPRILGVDDWARRKGHTYGSILIDLERGEIIDLLPDRSAESFAQWLREHPGVEVISRDSASSYAEGARSGAPNAVQVADRWHLLKNLGDALVKLFDHHRGLIETQLGPPAAVAPPADPGGAPAQEPVPAVQEPAPTGSMEPPGATTDEPQLREPAATSPARGAGPDVQRERRRARYEEICQLYAVGWRISAIAERVGLHRDTVRAYLQAPSFPERQPHTRQPSQLDPFKPYILERWNAGGHTGSVILREIQAQGYQGGASTVLAYITQLRKAADIPPMRRVGVTAAPISDPAQQVPSSRELSWLVLRRSEKLEPEEQTQLEQLEASGAAVQAGIQLAQEF